MNSTIPDEDLRAGSAGVGGSGFSDIETLLLVLPPTSLPVDDFFSGILPPDSLE